MGVTAIVLTRDEERHIVSCLQTLAWVDELLVVDSGSQDRTAALARQAGARLVYRPFDDWARQRQFALGLARQPWVFFVDADERVTPELAEEVLEVIADTERDFAGYWVPRRNLILGHWMRATGWYPDYQLRLMRPDRSEYDLTRPVHELVRLRGPAGYLRGHLLHFTGDELRRFLRKQEQYARYAAEQMFSTGTRPKLRNYVLQPWREFWRRLWIYRGYRDGLHGLALSLLMAYYTWRTYVTLGRRWQEHDRAAH
jgi:glycosyltransferase involved in cell wall biosynthesis